MVGDWHTQPAQHAHTSTQTRMALSISVSIFDTITLLVSGHDPQKLGKADTSTSYNASVFKVITSNEWTLNLVQYRSDEFFKLNDTMDSTKTSKPVPFWKLSNAEWSGTYRRQYVSGRGDLYLFYNRLAYDIPQLQNQTVLPALSRGKTWGTQTTMVDLVSESADWILLPEDLRSEFKAVSAHILHGFSTKLENQSRVQISLYFMIIVVTFNFFKLAIMTLVLVTDRNAYLVTIGDAAASFLKRPDTCTDGKSTLGKEELFVTLGLQPLHPVSNAEEAKDLHLRSQGTWLPRPRPYLFSINRNGKVVYTML
jgi:hypothetical protein